MALACPECGFDLKPAFLESPDYNNCAICGSELSVLPFPACFAAPAAITPMDLRLGEEEATCFHHESKKARHSCTRCGKFLCALCGVEVGRDVLCPECLLIGEKGGVDARFERERTLYDTLALALAVIPAMTFSLSIFGAPAAIYVALRYWRRPTSIVRRFRWRNYAALALGLTQVAFWIFAFAVFARRAPR
jgi:hypothetical protein